MNPMYISATLICFANDTDAYVPELWAREGLALLSEELVMGNLVHKEFSNEIKNFGDVVNTRRPVDRSGRRRTDADDYEAKDVSSTPVRIALDQWFYDSFIIKDGEQTISFQELIPVYMPVSMKNIARMVERAILGRVHEVLKTPTTRVGRLNNLSASNARDYILDVRQLMNIQKAADDGRNIVVSPYSETAILKTDLFTKANERGDGGSALATARLGHLLGFDILRGNNTNYADLSAASVATGTVTSALAAGGSGSQATTITGYNVIIGEYATVAGNDQPTYVTAKTLNGGDTDAVTLHEANKFATLSSAVITVYKACDVNGAYAVGYSKFVTLDGHTASLRPQVGQLVAFGTSTRHVYTVIEVENVSTTSTKVLLDRPLEVLLSDDDKAFPGPAGSMNLAFRRSAIALISRPLALPPVSNSVAAANASWDGLGMRVVMQYDSVKGGTRVNLDILAGVEVIDANQAVAFLG